MIAAKIANMSHGGDRRSDQDANLHLETSRAEAAQLTNVSTRSVATAKEVLDHGDEETIERVRDGKESVHKAAAKTKAARRDKQLVAQMVMDAPDVICWLIRLGMQFDHDGGDLRARRPGGATADRILCCALIRGTIVAVMRFNPR